MRTKKRAPRLPGHLSRSEASFTSCQSAAETDTFTERPTSRCSNFDPAESVYSQDLGRADCLHKEQRCTNRPTHDSVRPTLSPLLHSAIVHGVTPKARVKGAERAIEAPTIKSVLGFHSGEPDNSPTYWAADSSYSPARGNNVAPLPPRTLATGPRMSMHSRLDPRIAARQPIFTPGDLVWYQHPSGPWIAGRVVGVEQHSNVPVYAVVTVEDGVRRIAQEAELQLRTSGQHPPAEIINMSTSFEGLQVSNSSVQLRPAAQCVQSSAHSNIHSSVEEDARPNPSPKGADANVNRQSVPFERQSCDLEGSGLEKLRRFSSDREANELDPVPEDTTGAADQHASHDNPPQYSIVPLSQPSDAAGVSDGVPLETAGSGH